MPTTTEERREQGDIDPLDYHLPDDWTRHPTRTPREIEERVIELRETTDMTQEQIGLEVGLPRTTVSTILIRHRIEQECGPDRERRQGRRLPRELEEQVAALAIATSMTAGEIAEAVGLPRSTVQNILARLGDDETFTRLRQEQKRAWVTKAWEAVEHLTMAAVKGAEKLARDDADLTARDVRDLTVAAGIMVDKTALVLGETGPGSGGGQTREIADAVLGAWQAGREEGRREASPVNVTPQNVIDAEAEVR